ncbi:MAG: DUF6789 family protein [Pseudomonadota bacterium]
MFRALFAAAVATVAVAAVVYFDEIANFLPQLSFLTEIANFNARLGLPLGESALWITHAVFGIVLFGPSFAFLQPVLPGGTVGEGITFGLLTWLAMMMVFMPLSGHEIFAQDLGVLAAVGTLGLNLVYGIVLGIATAVFPANSD